MHVHTQLKKWSQWTCLHTCTHLFTLAHVPQVPTASVDVTIDGGALHLSARDIEFVAKDLKWDVRSCARACMRAFVHACMHA